MWEKTYEERLKSLGLERRNRPDIIEVFKMYRGYSSVALQELLEIDTNSRGTRGHSCKLKKVRCTRDIAWYFFSNRVINRWNVLDQSAVDTPSINAFKQTLVQVKPDGLLYGLVLWALGLAGRWLAGEAAHGKSHNVHTQCVHYVNTFSAPSSSPAQCIDNCHWWLLWPSQ